jgi:hypothetical protein
MNLDDVDDFSYIGSSIGNAYFSGLSFSELWDCISLSSSREDLDAAIDFTIKLKEIQNDHRNK